MSIFVAMSLVRDMGMDTVSFGSWLRQRRRVLDLTRDELARRLGYSVSTLRRIEADELRPSRQLAETLADNLDLTSEEQVAFVNFARGDTNPPALPLPATTTTAPLPMNNVRVRHNLPVPPTRLIGRESELAAVRGLLLRDEVRLVTFVGPGGTGKTRLALQIAADLVDEFSDGVYFVNLAPITEAARVPTAIAQTLTLRETEGQTLAEVLRDGLHDKHMLIILDNFEQVIGAAPGLSQLLGAAPRLKILVTSRMLLRLRGEQVFEVPPLALPILPTNGQRKMDRPAHSSGQTPKERGLKHHHHPPVPMNQSPAVQLFVQRAHEIAPTFALTDDNVTAIAHICARLDGLPLAIELAAARIRLLSPQDILTRLNSVQGRLPLLTGGSRDLPARQQTLRDTMTWSYDLLDDREKTLFRRLSVFVNGWAMPAAEIVAGEWELRVRGSDPIVLNPLSSIHVLDGIASLVDKSLVQRLPGPGPRFSMLETIREYALEQLEASGEAEIIRRRHVDYYLTLAEDAEVALRGPQQVGCLNRLEAEHDNLRAAIDWCRASGDVETSIRLVAALYWFWLLRGYASEGRERVEAALSLMTAMSDTGVTWSQRTLTARAKALEGSARLMWGKGKKKLAMARIDESLALWRELDDKRGLARALRYKANVKVGKNLALRNQLLEESEALQREIGDEWGRADTLLGLAEAAVEAKDYERALRLYNESKTLFGRLGDRLGVAWTLHSLAHLYYMHDNPAARAAYEEALAIFREIGDRANIGSTLNMVGEVMRTQDRYAEAEAAYTEAQALYHAINADWSLTISSINLGYVALHKGETQRAARLLRDVMKRYQEHREMEDMLMVLVAIPSLVGVSAVVSDDGCRGQAAARLFGALTCQLESSHVGLDPADQMEFNKYQARVREWLGDETFEMAWRAGYSIPLAEIVSEAWKWVELLV